MEADIHLAILTAAGKWQAGGMWHVAYSTRSKQLNWRPIIQLSFVCAHIEIECSMLWLRFNVIKE